MSVKQSPYGVIYMITCNISGKIYVGQTIKDPLQRLRGHFSSARKRSNRSKINSAIRKYGEENFLIEVIEECHSDEMLDQREIHWISELDCIEEGYNTLPGGNVSYRGITGEDHPSYGKRKSEEARRRMSEGISDEERKRRSERLKKQGGVRNADLGRKKRAENVRKYGSPLKGRTRDPEANQKQREAMLGRKMPEETKRKISASLSGRKLSEEHKQNLRKPKSKEGVENMTKAQRLRRGISGE